MRHDVPESAYAGIHGVSDWYPGRRDKAFRDNYDRIFRKPKETDNGLRKTKTTAEMNKS